MGGVPVKHHSKSKVGRRRAHLAVKSLRIAPCLKCKGPTVPHRACRQCGFYESGRRRRSAGVPLSGKHADADS